ncbi:methyltransferase domain-containing protein [Candidatus Parcubacteria bacterium]|nr:methyltransferase domain-containing protein [Candidatus Parcubacteria bacterium]
MTFFILGSHPALSLAEITAVLGEKTVVAQTPEVLVLDEVTEDAAVLQERLGGTVKIGGILGEMAHWNEEEAADLIASFAREASGTSKIRFGISAYGLGSDTRLLGKAVKARLKETGRSVRFVTSKEPALSSVIVTENDLLASGGEYVLIQTRDTVWIGQTQTVQDFKAWSQRDYGRPSRDAKSGMLPPKLARMMVNLSGADPKGQTLLDPFCGSGTILAEAMLMGFHTLIGSDISQKAIDDTKQNLDWLAKHAHLAESNLSLLVHDVRTLDEVLPEPVDVIVTETYLGKPRTRLLTPRESEQQSRELVALLQPAVETLARLLKSGGVCVMAIPLFKTKNGFKPIGLEPVFARASFGVEGSFTYFRQDQIVGRQICVLRKP